MTNVIHPPQFNRGPAIRCVDPVGEGLAILRLAELKSGVEASEATADELERQAVAVQDILASYGRPL